MSDLIRAFRCRGAFVAGVFAGARLLLATLVGVTSGGCSLAYNLDDLRNPPGQDDASVADAERAIGARTPNNEAGEPSDAGFRTADSMGAKPVIDTSDGDARPPDVSHRGGPTATDAGLNGLAEASPADSSDDRGSTPETGALDASADAYDAGMDAKPAAATDATPGVDSGDGGTWCALHASATTVDCHDFDEGQPAQFGFMRHSQSGDYASVTTTDFAPGSNPGALLMSTPSLLPGAPSEYEQLGDFLPFHPTKVELSFALKIVNYDVSSGGVSLFQFSSGAWALDFELQQGGASLVESKPGSSPTGPSVYPAAQPSPIDVWTTVDCLFDAVKHTVSLSYDGVVVLRGQPIAGPPIAVSDEGYGSVLVQTGLNHLGAPAKPMRIYYDNILISTPR